MSQGRNTLGRHGSRNITPLVIQFSLGASSGILQSVWQKTQSLWCSSHLSMHSACRARPPPHRQWVRPASGPSWSSAAAAQQRHERLDGACLSDGHLVVRRGENDANCWISICNTCCCFQGCQTRKTVVLQKLLHSHATWHSEDSFQTSRQQHPTTEITGQPELGSQA